MILLLDLPCLISDSGFLTNSVNTGSSQRLLLLFEGHISPFECRVTEGTYMLFVFAKKSQLASTSIQEHLVVWKLPGGYVQQLEAQNSASICLLLKHSNTCLYSLCYHSRNVKIVTFQHESERTTSENKRCNILVFSCEWRSVPQE